MKQFCLLLFVFFVSLWLTPGLMQAQEESFPFGEPQVAFYLTSVDHLLNDLEHASTLLRFPVLKSQVAANLKAWFGTGQHSYLDTQRKIAVLAYQPLTLMQNGVAVIIPVQQPADLLNKLNLFGIALSLNTPQEYMVEDMPLWVCVSEKNCVLSPHRPLVEALTDNAIEEQLSRVSLDGSWEFRYQLHDLLQSLAEQVPVEIIAGQKIDEVKAMLAEHPQAEVLLPWLDSCKGVIHGLLNGLDALRLGAGGGQDGINAFVSLETKPDSGLAQALGEISRNQLSLCTAFPSNAYLLLSDGVNITPGMRTFARGLITFLHVIAADEMRKNDVEPPIQEMVTQFFQAIELCSQNCLGEKVLASYSHQGQFYLLGAGRFDNAEGIADQINALIEQGKEFVRQTSPRNPMLSGPMSPFKTKTLGIVGGRELKTLFSIPTLMIRPMIQQDPGLRALFPEGLRPYFGNYIHVAVHGVQGMLLIAVGGDQLAAELETMGKAMSTTQNSLPYTGYLSLNLQPFISFGLHGYVLDTKRRFERAQNEEAERQKRQSNQDEYDTYWNRRYLKRKEIEYQTAQQILQSFERLFVDGLIWRETYTLSERGVRGAYGLPNQTMEQLGHWLMDMILLGARSEYLIESMPRHPPKMAEPPSIVEPPSQAVTEEAVTEEQVEEGSAPPVEETEAVHQPD